jgi:hypothetical protein
MDLLLSAGCCQLGCSKVNTAWGGDSSKYLQQQQQQQQRQLVLQQFEHPQHVSIYNWSSSSGTAAVRLVLMQVTAAVNTTGCSHKLCAQRSWSVVCVGPCAALPMQLHNIGCLSMFEILYSSNSSSIALTWTRSESAAPLARSGGYNFSPSPLLFLPAPG